MKKSFAVIAVVVFVVALLFSFFQWLFAPHYVERFELKALRVQPSTNGSVQVVLLLTNEASASLNVVDDSFGHPFIAYKPGNGMRYAISTLANMGVINLALGECLTNSGTLTDAAQKFRLSCEIRDLGAEQRVWSVYLFMPKSMAHRFVESRRAKEWDFPPIATEWIGLNSFTNQTTRTP